MDRNVLYGMQFASAPESSLHSIVVELMCRVLVHDLVVVDVESTWMVSMYTPSAAWLGGWSVTSCMRRGP